MSLPTADNRANPAARPDIAFNLLAVLILVSLVAVAAAYIVDAAARRSDLLVADRAMILRTVAGVALSIPRGWLRDGGADASTFSSQIVLNVKPNLASQGRPVEVTLVSRSRVRPSAALLDTVYLHQFGPQTLPAPPGLVGKPLVGHGTLPEESVWYDPLSATPFVARCLRPILPDNPKRCMRTAILPSGLAAIYAFDADVLPDWRQFDAEMQRLLESINAW